MSKPGQRIGFVFLAATVVAACSSGGGGTGRVTQGINYGWQKGGSTDAPSPIDIAKRFPWKLLIGGHCPDETTEQPCPDGNGCCPDNGVCCPDGATCAGDESACSDPIVSETSGCPAEAPVACGDQCCGSVCCDDGTCDDCDPSSTPSPYCDPSDPSCNGTSGGGSGSGSGSGSGGESGSGSGSGGSSCSGDTCSDGNCCATGCCASGGGCSC
jgi:hypothetical protein